MLNKPMADAIVGQLVTQCLDQLDREEANLCAIIRCLKEIRQCAIENNLDRLSRLLRDHKDLQASGQAIADDRHALRAQLASVLSVPQRQATIRSLAQLAEPHQAERLIAARQRLILLVRQANSLGQSIVMLVQQSMNLMSAILECVTGEARNDGYTRSGGRDDPRSPSILKFQC